MRLWLVLLVLLSLSASGPSSQAQTYNVGKVGFRNAGSFAPADLEAVAKFHAGTKASLADIQGAAQRLMDTGFFEDVKVDSSAPAAAPTIVFVLVPLPAGQMLPVRCDNLLWLTADETRQVVHTLVPLYRGELPETSTQLEDIDKALADALVAKNVVGAKVRHEIQQPTTAEPTAAIVFQVSYPSISVEKISLKNTEPLATEEASIAAKLHNAPFVGGDAPQATIGHLLEPYLDLGYLKVRLKDAHAVPEPISPDHYGVNLEAEVQHGELYRVSGLMFADTPLFSQGSFASSAKLHVGDVASRAQLLTTTAPIDQVYHHQGYMYEYVNTGAVLDDTAHTVNYHLAVVAGEQYRLHTVVVQGLPPDARAQFDLAWKMKPGELYDADYVSGFIASNTAMQGLSKFVGTFEAKADPATHLVDLTVLFMPSPGRH